MAFHTNIVNWSYILVDNIRIIADISDNYLTCPNGGEYH